MILELPALPFDSHQLEPYLSKAWVEERYQGDHQRHLTALNRWASGTGASTRSLEDVVSEAHGEVLEHALEAWRLTLFWHCLLPRPAAPEGRLNEELTQAFGSFTGLREAMHGRVEDELEQGNRRPGWLWLLHSNRGMSLTISARDQRLDAASGRPLLVLDLGCGKSPVEQLWPLIHWGLCRPESGRLSLTGDTSSSSGRVWSGQDRTRHESKERSNYCALCPEQTRCRADGSAVRP